MRTLLALALFAALLTPPAHAGIPNCLAAGGHHRQIDQFRQIARVTQADKAYISKVGLSGWIKIDLGGGKYTWSHPDYVNQNLSTVRWLWGFPQAKIVSVDGK